MEKVAGVDRNAALPKYHGRTFVDARAAAPRRRSTQAAPAFGRKAVLYATCFVNYNNPAIGEATQAVLAKNGVATEVVYPAMLRHAAAGAGRPRRASPPRRSTSRATLGPYIDKGYDIVALVPSCALMLKFEWPLIAARRRGGEDACRDATFDISRIRRRHRARKRAWRPGSSRSAGGVTLHIACHARAQNMGQKAAEMLRLLPDAEVDVIERCSGHGGSWGVMKENFETALKVGRPVARQALRDRRARSVASECPLAGMHILQGMEIARRATRTLPQRSLHPIELFARAYGLAGDGTTVSEDGMNASEARSAAADPRRHPAARRLCQGPPRATTRDHRAETAAPRRGRPVRDLLFRELRRRCGSRSRRCSTSRRAARRRSRTSSRPITR